MESKTLEVPNEILLAHVRQAIEEGHTVTINVKGYSMRPFLEHNRDKVVLKACVNPCVGDAVLAEIRPGTFVLHRVIRRDGERLTLMGDGNLRGTESCLIKHVVGVVSYYIHHGKMIAADDARLKRKIRLWKRLLPVRRYLLILYKVKLKIKT